MQPRPASPRPELALPAAAPLVDAQRRQAIGHSHQRSLALGVSATAVPEISPAPAVALRESREQHRRLYQQAAPVMEMLFEQIVSTHSMVVLTDPQGTILHAVGDNGFLEKAQRVALAPGVNWSEASKGTNAIGTALFNEAPTLVHGGEHFVRANHFLTCSAAPILDHAGQLLGVLDVTGDQQSYHPHTLAMVSMSARLIENQWINDRFRHGLRLCLHPRPEMLGTMREGMLALSAEGAILGANRSAIEMLGLTVAALRMMGLEAVLGITLPRLADHFRQAGDQPLAVQPLHPAAGAPLWLRAQFNWPSVWAAGGAPTTAAPVVQGATSAAAQVVACAALPAPVLPATEGAAAEANTLQEQEIAAIRRAVQAAGGNIARAARQLGVARNTVYRKLKGG
jgi:transcriptional regulator of acetoin/glycerol metabolism